MLFFTFFMMSFGGCLILSSVESWGAWHFLINKEILSIKYSILIDLNFFLKSKTIIVLIIIFLLQCCNVLLLPSFNCPLGNWRSAISIHISPPSWASIPPAPHTTPLGHHRAPSWAPCIIQQVPTSYLFHTCRWTNASFLILPTPPFPHCVHMSILYIWVSIPTLKIVTSAPSFQISCPTLYNPMDYIYIYIYIYTHTH